MWRLFNYLFGWDYIYWNNGISSGIARIHKDFNGGAWYYLYKVITVIGRVRNANDVVWLTCEPDKYINNN